MTNYSIVLQQGQTAEYGKGAPEIIYDWRTWEQVGQRQNLIKMFDAARHRRV